jgi:hypothetical protein
MTQRYQFENSMPTILACVLDLGVVTHQRGNILRRIYPRDFEADRRNLGREIRGRVTEEPLHALTCIALHSSGIGK